MDINTCVTFTCNFPFLVLKERLFASLPWIIFTVTNVQSVLCTLQRKGYFKSLQPVMQALPLGNRSSSKRKNCKLECHLSFAEKHCEDLPTRSGFSKPVLKRAK